MGTTLKVKLNNHSVENAIKAVNEYSGSLETRTRVFVGKLTEMGLEVAKARIAEAPLGKYVSISVNYKNPPYGCVAMLYATGQELYSEMGEGSVNALLLIEFGAGVAVNPESNPFAGQFGMGVGTYGKGHGNDPSGWNYLDKNGKWQHTLGTKATMPMFKAWETMMQNIQRVAEEVFTTHATIEC